MRKNGLMAMGYLLSAAATAVAAPACGGEDPPSSSEDGGSDASAATSDSGAVAGETADRCEAILLSDASAADGPYLLDIDGDGPAAAREYYCDMSGGGWTLVANQMPEELLPDDQDTVNVQGFGSETATYRLGTPDITAIRPGTGWKLTDDSNAVYFKPSCVVDWDMIYVEDTEGNDCTVGYESEDFAATTNPTWVYASVRGIGINNYGSFCSIRIYESETSASRPAGEAGPCDYYETDQRVSLWFK